MRKTVIITSIIMSMLVVSCGKKSESTQDNESNQVRTIISNVTGSVTIKRADANQPANSGMLLQPADQIITQDKSSVELAMQGFGVVKIGSNAEVSLLELVKDKQGDRASLDVKRGDVASVISRQDPDSEYSIKTPTAIAGVRGTSFVVSVDDTDSRIAVLDGKVAVNQPGQEEVIIEKNSQLVINRQKKLSRDMVQPLSAESLKRMKDLTVFHKSNVLEFNTLVEDLQKNSKELTVLEGEIDMDAELDRRDSESSAMDTDSVSRAKRADISKTLKRDTRQDPLKLEAQKSYDKE